MPDSSGFISQNSFSQACYSLEKHSIQLGLPNIKVHRSNQTEYLTLRLTIAINNNILQQTFDTDEIDVTEPTDDVV